MSMAVRELPADPSTIVVVSLLAAAVGWAIHASHALMALDGVALMVHGALLAGLSLSIRWWLA